MLLLSSGAGRLFLPFWFPLKKAEFVPVVLDAVGR